MSYGSAASGFASGLTAGIGAGSTLEQRKFQQQAYQAQMERQARLDAQNAQDRQFEHDMAQKTYQLQLQNAQDNHTEKQLTAQAARMKIEDEAMKHYAAIALPAFRDFVYAKTPQERQQIAQQMTQGIMDSPLLRKKYKIGEKYGRNIVGWHMLGGSLVPEIKNDKTGTTGPATVSQDANPHSPILSFSYGQLAAAAGLPLISKYTYKTVSKKDPFGGTTTMLAQIDQYGRPTGRAINSDGHLVDVPAISQGSGVAGGKYSHLYTDSPSGYPLPGAPVSQQQPEVPIQNPTYLSPAVSGNQPQNASVSSQGIHALSVPAFATSPNPAPAPVKKPVYAPGYSATSGYGIGR